MEDTKLETGTYLKALPDDGHTWISQYAPVIILADERCPSRNDLYAGKHWTVRKEMVDRIHQAVRAAIDPEQAHVYKERVDIHVHAYYDSKPVDSDNVEAKVYIDGLKGWWIADDDMEHVRTVSTTAHMADNCYVMIEIMPVREENEDN